MNLDTKQKAVVIIVVILVSSLLLLPVLVNFASTEDNLRPVTHYGTVTIMKSNGVHVTSGATVDAEANDPLKVDLTFSVTTRPTTLTCRLISSVGATVEVGSLYKGATYWRWSFSMDPVAAGTNTYYISFEGSHDIYSIYYKSFAFYIIGTSPTYPAPTISDRPSDLTVTEGVSKTLTWRFICQAGGFYTIQKGNTLLQDGDIVGSLQAQTVDFDTAGLDIGSHTLVFMVRGSDDQDISDSVVVTVEEIPVSTTSTTTTTTTTSTGTGTISTTTPEPTLPDYSTLFLFLGVGLVVVLLIYLKGRRS